MKRFAQCYRTVVCPVMSVTLVYCGQTVGRIKVPLCMVVGLGPGHIVLLGDPAAPKKGTQQPPLFGSCLMWPNGWMDQDATWYGGRPRPRPHCVFVRWGIQSPKGAPQPPTVLTMSVVAKWLDGSRCHLVRR